MVRLYHYEHSANCYKVRLLLAQLQKSYDSVHIDLLRDEQLTEDFRRISVNGKVPLLVPDSGEPISESAAILCYLAEGTPWYPSEPRQRIDVLQWLFYEQWSMAQSIKRIYAWTVTWALPVKSTGDLAPYRRRGIRFLGELDRHLAGRSFFVGERPTIADIALYGYVHLAPVAGFDVSQLLNLQRWFERIRSQPHYIEYKRLPESARLGTARLPRSLRSEGEPASEMATSQRTPADRET